MSKLKVTTMDRFLEKPQEMMHRGSDYIANFLRPEKDYGAWMRPGVYNNLTHLSCAEYHNSFKETREHRDYYQYPNDYYTILRNPEELNFNVQHDEEKTKWVRSEMKDETLVVEHMSFPSAYEEPRFVENNTVHVFRIGKPHNDTALLFMGGWGRGAKSPEMGLCGSLASKGVDAFIHIFPYHGLRRPAQSNWDGEFFTSPDLYWTVFNFRHVVSEARTILQWLDKKPYQRKGVMGYSIGSVLSTLTCNGQKNVDFFIAGILAANLSGMIWHNPLTLPLKKRLMELGYTQKDVQDSWALEDIKDIALDIDTDKVLMLSTRYDEVLRPEYQELAWEKMGKPKRVWLPSAHVTSLADPKNREKIVEQALSFIQP